MELRHLRYFVVLAEELHFGRAASRLAITQPPLSFNIKQLEDELGVRLLDRNNKRVSLTQAGQTFLVEALAILANADRARELARAVGAGRLGRLDIGFSGSTIYLDLAEITRRYASEYQGVEYVLHEHGLPDQISALEHGHLDLGFVDSVNIPEGLAGLALREESYVCCVSSSHPLADRDTIDLALLANDPFVSFQRKGSPTSYDRVMALCTAAGFVPKVVHAVRQWLTILALVSQDFGVALVPSRMIRTGFQGVRFIPVDSTASATSVGHILWNPDRMNERIAAFIEVTRQVKIAADARLAEAANA